MNELEVFKVPTYTWPDFLDACKLVAAGNHKFKTIVIDTVDNAFKYCSDHVNAQHNIEYEGDLPHGKGWSFVKNEWHRVLTKLASLPYGLVLISHAVDREVLVDIILFCDATATKDKDGNVTTQRIVRTKPHPAYEAGDRTGRLPETIPLDFEAFAKAFTVAPQAQPQKTKEVST